MITVNKSALSDTDDTGESVAPEVGDMVDLGKAKARVASIDGDNYGLEILEVNGQPATYGKKEEPDESDDEKPESDDADMETMGKNLLAKAERADKRAGF